MPPVWRCVSRQSHLAAFERGASKRPPARVPQGPSDDVSCREMARFSKSREERHAWSGRYATEAHDPPAQDGEGRARARGLVVRGEPHDRVGNALPAVGQQQRQGPPRPAAGRRAAALGGGDGRRRRRGRREGLSRRCSPWRPAQGLPGSGGGDPLGYGELAPPAPSPPSSVASRESTEALVGGGHLRR